ncbi:MAG: YggT family protein [Clostridiales bacterium]|nr:YggT family protein [Clostridiales bacterium]
MIKHYREHRQIMRVKRFIFYILSILEFLLVIRLIFKTLGANPRNAFVSGIYSSTDLFLIPFRGIFHTAISKGFETQSVLEPTIIIAIVIYAVIAWGIVKLIEISNNHV